MEKHIADLFHRIVDGLAVHEKEKEQLHEAVDEATEKPVENEEPEGGPTGA